MSSQIKTQNKLPGNSFKSVAIFLFFVAVVVIAALGPEIYREFKAERFSRQQKACFEMQKDYEEAVRQFLQKNPDKLFSPGLLNDSELTSALLEQKLLIKLPACPAEGILRIGSLDMSGAYVVTCSVHGSHDRPATIGGQVELQTQAGGKLLYDVGIIRDNADVLATYLLSIGILAQPNTSVRVFKLDDRLQIVFNARVDMANLDKIREKFAFHAGEISAQIFNGQPLEFKMLSPEGKEPLVIKSK